ncbi:50S ribosomal protein L24 [Acinetobacter baumannii]|uniref:50S ribosomal protein L24 n=1 Tax=Acinetobacter baumannii TaxID=470 RepID=UPI0022781496|nr:50S ribosomal protein L24 [Acinetobacter baumannii]MCY3373201.1 50S ribosomal protein L24 [Acinetobacter baumannii]
MAGLSVKKGDTVQVISGKDKGAKGKVIATDAERERVLVEGVNRITKHTKVTQSSRGSQQGGLVTTEAPIHVSNVQLVDEDGRPTRVGYRREKVQKNRADGSTYEAERSVRISRRTGKDI